MVIFSEVITFLSLVLLLKCSLVLYSLMNAAENFNQILFLRLNNMKYLESGTRNKYSKLIIEK